MNRYVLVNKMIGYTSKILGYCEGTSYEEFAADSKLAEACVFNLSQIGELCRVADEAFEEEHPEIPWRSMNGLRNRIVHDYEGVNLILVWEIITEDLPELQKLLKEIDFSSGESGR